MYGLVKDGEIVVGVRNWKASIFKKYLDDNGLDYSGLPNTDPKGAIFTDEWQLLPVGEKTIPPHDSMYEQLAGPFYTINADSIDVSYNVVDLDLHSSKNKHKAEVTKDRYEVEVGGVDYTLADGTVVNLYTNREYRNTYLDAMLTIPDGSTVTFKFKGGKFKTVDKVELEGIVGAVVSHVQAAFDWEAGKMTEIDGCVSLDELKLVDIVHPDLVVEDETVV